MHKNIPVADIDIDETLGGKSKIRNIISKEHIPVGVVRMQRQNETVDRYAFNQWWTGRSISASRMGLSDMLDTLGISRTNLLLTKCLGLSLSDHYWVKPYDSDMTWERAAANLGYLVDVNVKAGKGITNGLKITEIPFRK